ncbi:MAG: flagellar hook assembly protein FlgD [Thermodesulfobacteriota bacterium]
MSIEALSGIYGESGLVDEGPSSSKTQDKLGKDEFLTLLITQLQNQDPLNPLESTEFTQQLAQFNSLEQLFSINDNLANIQKALDSQEEDNLLDLIGKTVKADDDTILVQEGKVVPGSYSLDEAADVTISVYDSNGSEVRTLQQGALTAGNHDVVWDGRSETGERMADGVYTFDVSARNEEGNPVAAHTYTWGEVTGVTYEHLSPYLMIGEKLVSAHSEILEVANTVQEQTHTVTENKAIQAGP